MVNKKYPLYHGNLEQVKSFTFVGDIIKCLENALHNYKTLNGEIINLGHFENHSTQDGISIIEKILKKHMT